MEVRWDNGLQPKITDIKAKVKDGQVTLTFKWPNELEYLYIYKQNKLKEEVIDWEKPYRKYTKEEYACFGGFKDLDLGSAMSQYILCPYIQSEDGNYIVRYKEGCNQIEVIGHQINIRYEMKEKKKLFSSRKLVQIQVFCDTPIPKEYLCYVKKSGSIPVGREDGMCFQFISDFAAGDNRLPEIEVDKEEYIRIYLTEEVPHKEAYRVMKS